jgi:hypothetical protein
VSNARLINPGDKPDLPVYSIPAALFHAFPDRPVMLRTDDPAEPERILGREVPEGLVLIQLTDLSADMAPLAAWGEGLPLDLMMGDPVSELPLLYRCTELLARHPVRVTVPLKPGAAPAVKLALSLGFAVRLAGHQPSPDAVAEAGRVLDGYLHNPTVSQPVEPFHGLLLALLHDSPLSLWSLLERDPAQIRMIDQSGAEVSDQAPASVQAFRGELLAQGAECQDCEWLGVCSGYFKWPRTDYSCRDVKLLLADLKAAAAELRQGLADCEASLGGSSNGI